MKDATVAFKKALAILLVIITAQASAVDVAVLDSGVTAFPELAPYLMPSDILPGGFDFVNNDPDPADDNGHGTIIASIVVLTSGNTAKILPVKILGASGGGPPGWGTLGIEFAASKPNVRILSLSLRSNVFQVDSVAALQRAAGLGKIIVMAAGNTGLPNPDFPAGVVNQLQGRGIAVGAVGPNNVIRPYSARAGNSMQHYLVAYDFEELGVAGTSFSAPQVSGTAAAVLAQAPFLSPNEVVDILLRSADDLGPIGTDPIYGHGLLNPVAALTPIGVLSVPTSDTVTEPGAAIEQAAMEVGPAIAAALLDNSEIEKTFVLDEYKRPFEINFRDLVHVKDWRPTMTSLLDDFSGIRQGTEVRLAEDHKLSISISEKLAESYYPCHSNCEIDASDRNTTVAMSLSGNTGKGLHYGFNINKEPSEALGAWLPKGNEALSFVSRRGLVAPYLSFSDQVDSASIGYAVGDRFDMSFGFVTTDEDRKYGQRSLATAIKGVYNANDTMSIWARLGRLSEAGSLFGGSSAGAFGVDESNTTALSLGTHVQLTSSIALLGHYTRGRTEVDDVKNSLLHNFSGLYSEAYGIALFIDGVFKNEDKFGVAIARPIRVIEGAVDLEIPIARSFDGRVSRVKERVSLVPQGSETDIEISYRVPVRKHTTIGTNLVYRIEPNHSKKFGNEISLYAVMKHEF